MSTPLHRPLVRLVGAGLILSAVIALLATGVGSPPAGATTAAPPSTAPLRAGLTSLVSVGATPGALGVVTTGTRTTFVSAGQPSVAGPQAFRLHQPFRAGSVTKSIVATLVLRLVSDGTLRLDDTVERWLPGMLPRGRELSVRSLLQHTSGLSDHLAGPTAGTLLAPLLGDPAHRFAPSELVRSVARRPLLFEPGTGWAYSNTNYVLLGLIVEAATGQPLGRVLERRLLRPLDLHETRLPRDASLPPNAVHGYLLTGNELVRVPPRRPLDVTLTDPSFTWAAGAVTATAPDLGRFYRTLLGGNLLPRRFLEAMTRTRPIGSGMGYGLGLLRVDTPCGPLFGHDGETLGYTTMALASRDGKRSVVVAANSSHRAVGGRSLVGRLATLARDTLCPPRQRESLTAAGSPAVVGAVSDEPPAPG